MKKNGKLYQARIKKHRKLSQARMRASILATMYATAATELIKLTITGGTNPEKIEAEIDNVLAFLAGKDEND